MHITGVDPLKTEKYCPLAVLEVGARGQARLHLGTFTSKQFPRGYIVGVDSNNEEQITSQVIAIPLDKADSYKMVLFAANFGDKAIVIEVWQV